MSRARTFPCTVSLDVSDLAAEGLSRPDVVSAIVDQFPTMPIAAFQFFGTEAKVTFEKPEDKRSVMQHGSVCIRGVDCAVRGGGPRPQNVLIYNLPFEIEHATVKTALSFFGEIEYVHFRHWTHLVDVCDGVRTVRMVRTRAIPRNVIIDGFPVKVSYVGQEPECDICGKKGHIARSCDMRGKCMECKESGHFQRNCPVRRRRLADPDVHPPVVVDPDPGMPESASAGPPPVPTAAAPASSPVIEGAPSQVVSQSILADVSCPRVVAPSVPSESVDSRDNQLDELISSGSIGADINYSDSLFGAVVSTPNSNLSKAGDHPPNSNLIVNQSSKSESPMISNDIINSESHENDNNSKDIVNSESNENDNISNDMVISENDDSNVSDKVDNDEVNDNVYETSSEGLLSDGESSDNDSENEESSDYEIANVKSRSKLPVAGSVGSRVPKVAGAGVSKAKATGPSLGARKAAQDWSVLSQRRR